VIRIKAAEEHLWIEETTWRAPGGFLKFGNRNTFRYAMATAL